MQTEMKTQIIAKYVVMDEKLIAEWFKRGSSEIKGASSAFKISWRTLNGGTKSAAAILPGPAGIDSGRICDIHWQMVAAIMQTR